MMGHLRCVCLKHVVKARCTAHRTVLSALLKRMLSNHCSVHCLTVSVARLSLVEGLCLFGGIVARRHVLCSQQWHCLPGQEPRARGRC
jgi:hypothetical protein